MEIFTIKIDGSYRVTFRKSLPLIQKTILANELLKIIDVNATTKVIKGVAVIYLSYNQKSISEIIKIFQNLKSEKFEWDNHFN